MPARQAAKQVLPKLAQHNVSLIDRQDLPVIVNAFQGLDAVCLLLRLLCVSFFIVSLIWWADPNFAFFKNGKAVYKAREKISFEDLSDGKDPIVIAFGQAISTVWTVVSIQFFSSGLAAGCVVLASLTDKLRHMHAGKLKSDKLAELQLVQEAKKTTVSGFPFLSLSILALF